MKNKPDLAIEIMEAAIVLLITFVIAPLIIVNVFGAMFSLF